MYCNSSGANSRVKTLSGANPCVFSGNVAPGVAEVGSLFPQVRASIWESCRQKVHRTVARARFHKNMQKMEVRRLAPDLCGRVRPVHAAPTWIDLVRRSCYAGLQPVVTKHMSTAARSKASVMLRRSCFAGLQLEVAKQVCWLRIGMRKLQKGWLGGSRRSSLRGCSEKKSLREDVPQRRGRSVKK